jgi:predicted metal-dependent peptidase
VTIEQKLSQAKARLLVQNPYFGTLASRLEFKKNDNIQSFLSNGVSYEYNDAYLKDLDLDEIGFTLSNAAMHIALAHDNRQKKRMSWLWQLATDHAINSMLIENGLDAPFGVNYQSRFDGMYAEEIYAILKDEIKNQEYDDNEENDTGFNEENRKKESEEKAPNSEETKDKLRSQQEVDTEERAVDEEAWKQNLEEASEKFKNELPEGIERFYEKEESKVDWRAELYNAIDRHYYHDYKLIPPSKKLLYMGTYLPSLSSNMLRIVVAIDSSGSVNEVLLGEFISEFESILLSFSSFEIDLLICDDKIHSTTHFSSGDKLEYELKGGGATDFNPVFENIETELYETQLLLYFTDLEGKFPQNEPLVDTIWVTNSLNEVPFGKVIRI